MIDPGVILQLLHDLQAQVLKLEEENTRLMQRLAREDADSRPQSHP